jgi:tight adherence protein B
LTAHKAAASVGSESGEELFRDERLGRFKRLDHLLTNQPLARAISADLARAHVPLRVGEFAALSAGLALCGAYVGLFVAKSALLALVLAVALGALPKLYVNRRQAQRVKNVESQLIDLLSLSSNSLKSGWGFLQAMEQVASELPPPVSEEVRQVLEELSLGATPEQALHALAQRIPSYDLELVVTAVLIQRRTGGNLSDILDGIAGTVRARIQLMMEVRAITAESRMSAWLLSLLPIAMLAVLSAVNPTYLDPLLHEEDGRTLLAVAAGLEICGVFLLKRLSALEV